MAHRLYDFVAESSVTAGTNDFELAGAVNLHNTFASFMDDQDTTEYSSSLINDSGDLLEFETGVGRFDETTNRLVREIVLTSSNNDEKVSFSAGTKLVRCTPIAATALTDRNGIATDRDQGNTPAQMAQGRGNLGLQTPTNLPLPMAKAPSELEWLTTSSIRVKPGSFRSEDDASNIVIPTAIDITSISVGNNAHRHVLAGRDGSGDPAATLSETVALPDGWQSYRRVGSIRTDGSGNVRQFFQFGDRFYWHSLINDVSVLADPVETVSLGVPLGVDVEIMLIATATPQGDSNRSILVRHPDLNTTSPTGTGAAGRDLNAAPDVPATVLFQTAANQAGQVVVRSSTGGATVRLWVRGWVDRRGRDK